MILGPLCCDYNIDFEGYGSKELGGAVYFSYFAARATNANVYASIKMSEADYRYLEHFPSEKESIKLIPSSVTTQIRNQYFTADRERRISSSTMQSDEITIDEVPDVPVKLYHLAGLLVGDFRGDIIIELSKKGLVSADMQGFLRHRNPETGQMSLEDWPEKIDYIKYLTFLKVDAAEAEILTGLSDRKEAAKKLYEWGAKEIMISFNQEMLIYDGMSFYTCPVKSRNLSGRTGRGDTVFASYISKRVMGSSIKDSLLFATVMVSLKMETVGAFQGTYDDVINYMKEFYPEYQ